ncbi:MAG: protease inhibitor I42 family protein [Hyalangium sp.]|uniref:protease inhibitor I42 family protein n=1 Tax=Hyalangium sp. TaxID=2028555 RepID=UPI00389A747C
MDSPRLIELSVGQTHTERLPGLAAAGYTWTWSAEDSSNAVRVSMHRAVEVPKPGELPPGTQSFDESVELQALAPGTAVLRFALRRPWEDTPREVRTFQVRVTADVRPSSEEPRR